MFKGFYMYYLRRSYTYLLRTDFKVLCDENLCVLSNNARKSGT